MIACSRWYLHVLAFCRVHSGGKHLWRQTVSSLRIPSAQPSFSRRRPSGAKTICAAGYPAWRGAGWHHLHHRLFIIIIVVHTQENPGIITTFESRLQTAWSDEVASAVLVNVSASLRGSICGRSSICDETSPAFASFFSLAERCEELKGTWNSVKWVWEGWFGLVICCDSQPSPPSDHY